MKASSFVALGLGPMVVSLLLAACGGTETRSESPAPPSAPIEEETPAEEETPGSSGSPGGSSGSSGSSGSEEMGASQCDGSPVDVLLDKNGGTTVLHGKLTFSAPVRADQINVYVAGFGGYASGGSFGTGTGTTPKTVHTFEVRGNLVGSGWNVHVIANTNADGQLGEGDLAGFYNAEGLTAAPPWKATKVPTTLGQKICNLNISVGPIVCHKAWGEPCTSEAECRATRCECNDGASVSNSSQACNSTTKVCQRAPATIDCATYCGASGVKADRSATCLNK